jgi:hypothetical protein
MTAGHNLLYNEMMNIAHQNTKIAKNIRQCGWHCLHVFPTETKQLLFTCSIGFTQSFDASEIVVFGSPQAKAHALSQELAQLLHTVIDSCLTYPMIRFYLVAIRSCSNGSK